MNDSPVGRVLFLSDSEQMQDGLRLGGVGVWRWQVDSDRLLWSRNMEAVHALPAGSFDGTLSSFQRDVHPEDREKVWQAISTAIAHEQPYRMMYRTAGGRDGISLWLEASGGLVRDREGNKWLTGVCMDITQRIEAEQELQRRLRQQEAVADFGTFALGEEDFQAVADRAVHVAAEVLGVPLANILKYADHADHLEMPAGVGWKEGAVGTHTVRLEGHSLADYTLEHGGPVFVEDFSTDDRFSHSRILLDHGVVSNLSVVIAGAQGRPFGVLSAHAKRKRAFDAADAGFLTALANVVANSVRQIAAAQHRQLLVREMAHRAGNMLQLVSTLAHQTFHDGSDVASARAAFADRLGSLSRANYLVAKGGWSATRFRALAEEALEPFREHVEFIGRDVLLSPELCFDLGLILHELSTNSAKYGSLGVDGATVTLSWRIVPVAEGEGLAFAMEWLDARSEPPRSAGGGERRGFGTKLMRLLIERKWGGTIEPDGKQGYRFAFAIPLTEAALKAQD